MIRILTKNNLVYITGEPRTENELLETQLLYTYDLDYTQELVDRVRPFRDLGQKQECYKISILQKLPGILYQEYTPEVIGKEATEKLLSEIKEIASLLGYLEKSVSTIPITYTCDLWNYIEELYGEKEKDCIQEYRELRIEDKEFLKKLYLIPGDQKKFKIVSEYEGLQRIYDLLPSGIQENLMIFGTTLGRIGKEQCIPEFRNTTELLPPPPDLKEEIYKEFEVGEIFVEGASVVKERLQKVYDICEIPRISKMIDLSEYFDLTKQWIDGKRYVKLSYRKL
jgi:hypothetical protein